MVSQVATDTERMSTEQWIGLLLDLTRRIERLDNLLTASRERRCATDTSARPTEFDEAGLQHYFELAARWPIRFVGPEHERG